MVYLFSLRFEDDAGFDTPITEGDSRGGRFIPTEDRRRDHFPVLCIGATICSTLSLIQVGDTLGCGRPRSISAF
jgi:hypothetical protein